MELGMEMWGLGRAMAMGIAAHAAAPAVARGRAVGARVMVPVERWRAEAEEVG